MFSQLFVAVGPGLLAGEKSLAMRISWRTASLRAPGFSPQVADFLATGLPA